MRVLMLPRYAPLGASSRVRMYQYLPALQAAGMAVTVSPLFSDSYVRALYAGIRAPGEVLRAYARRVFAQWKAGAFDLVWVEKELLPWVPAVVERLRGQAAVVVDYDDAVFHRYDEHPFALVRAMLGRRIDAVMRRADVVTAGNAYLAARAEAAGCRRVERLPTVVDLERYALPQAREASGPVVIGWIGSPSTAQYLHEVARVVERLQIRHDVRAVAVGARADQVAGTPFEVVPWSEDREAALVGGFDIGIMPLPDAPWERGKCGYKLIQYMACGVPVVASPVGANREIVQSGVNGELASDSGEWEAALSRLIADAESRERMGMQGRRTVQDWYSLQAQAPRLIDILKQAALGGRA